MSSKINFPLGLKGWYMLEAVRSDGSRRLLADWFPNLITDLGLDMIGNSQPLTYCAVGSGNATPTFGDTALQSLVGDTTAQVSQTFTAASGSPYFGTTTTVYNFPAGTATGNLAEVGVGDGPASLFSRALILDGGGSPTTITVLSDEALYVTYQLNQYVPLTDVTGTVVIGGVSYNYTLRAADANQSSEWAYRNGDAGGINLAQIYSGTIGAITSSPSGTGANSDSVNNVAYSTGSFTLQGTATWNIATGNFGGVKSAIAFFGTGFASRGAFQVQFNNVIPKDASHVLTLQFSTSWVRI